MRRIIGLWLVVVVGSLFLGASADGSGDKVVRLRPALALVQDPAGTVVPYDNPAAHGWHAGTETPDRPDGGFDLDGKPVPGWPVNPATGKPILKWPIIALQAEGGIPAVVWYWDKSFRYSNGYKWTKPVRWAYLRLEEEKWNPATKQFDVPGLGSTTAPPPVVNNPWKGGVHLDDVAGQQVVDILKRSFPTVRIQDFMDASPYDEPDTGAPEDGPGAPPL